MTTYRINTPGPSFTRDFETPDAVLAWLEEQMPLTGKRVRIRGERPADNFGGPYYFTQVRTASGKLVTGAVAYEEV